VTSLADFYQAGTSLPVGQIQSLNGVDVTIQITDYQVEIPPPAYFAPPSIC
jgi:hypothetical protein